ncbi:MAG: hypothetical protein GXP08_14735 [Gammaproteobacteria bacterium]|nr:hypothetical protein [Gammaproteobacteria bacterium]
MNKANPVFEIVKWKSKPGVTDDEMITAINAMAADLKNLSGFLHQTLYKSLDGEWLDIYYWANEKNAHDSNHSMANKESFKNLIELIAPDTVSIEVIHQLQTSGKPLFNQ